jgi:hypothetical protein
MVQFAFHWRCCSCRRSSGNVHVSPATFGGRVRARMLNTIVVFMLSCIPSLAAACPSCMSQDPNRQKTFPILLGFIGIPFVIFAGATWVIRRALLGMGAGDGPRQRPWVRGR